MKQLSEMTYIELQWEYIKEKMYFKATGYYCRLAEIAYLLYKHENSTQSHFPA